MFKYPPPPMVYGPMACQGGPTDLKSMGSVWLHPSRKADQDGRVGLNPEYSIYGKLSLWEITRWDLIPLGNYPFTGLRPWMSSTKVRWAK